MKKWIITGMIIIVAIGITFASPLFYNTDVDEALPIALDRMQDGLTLERFQNMDEESRATLVDSMPMKIKEMIMDESAKSQVVVSEDMDDSINAITLKTGKFVGLAGHSAKGDAKILDVAGTQYLRFENFEVTNGPDLRVYLTQDGDVKQGIHIDKLKGNRGSQNYQITEIDTDTYNTVVVYCQPFGAYFGKAILD